MRRKYRRGAVKVALLYPSAYPVAMSSAVFHILYFKLWDAGFYVERFTADRGPRGVEEGTPLRHFDYIVASIHYELDYIKVVKMLKDGGVELRAASRERPKIVLGGPPLTANPEPLAELADVIVLGELEAVWEKLVEYMATGMEVGGPGLYYPAKGPTEVSIVYSNRLEVDYRRLPEPEAAFSLSVELARGCPYSCLYCMESYITKPYRQRDVWDVLDDLERLYKRYRMRPSMVALTADTHGDFKKLLSEAAARGIPLSIPSLRAELLDEETLELLQKLGQRTLTIAPETGERLRRALGKEISDGDILRVAKKAAGLGMRLKFYLMVGLPCEKEEDIRQVGELVREVKKAGVELYLSVNPAVPKPQTPLQYHPMTELRELERKIELVRKMPHDAFSHYDPTLAVIQAAIALGGRETFRHVEASVDTPLAYWKGLLRRGELRYVFSPRREPTPWSHVRGFYPPSRLWEIYQKFLESACS